MNLPARALSWVDESKARGKIVHLSHTFGPSAQDFIERVIEQPRRIFDTDDFKLGGKTQLKREPREETPADTMDGANECL